MTPETIPVDKVLWERCEGFLRDCASHVSSMLHTTEARAIVAQLPPPVDPLLLRARKICADLQDDDGCRSLSCIDFRSGKLDGSPMVRAVLKALREGEG